MVGKDELAPNARRIVRNLQSYHILSFLIVSQSMKSSCGERYRITEYSFNLHNGNPVPEDKFRHASPSIDAPQNA